MKINKLFTIAFLLLSIISKSQNQETGKAFIQILLQEKDYPKAYTFFDESMKTKISEAVLIETVEKLEKQLGKFKSVLETNNEKETYSYYSDFDNMKLDVKISFGENKKIIGLTYSCTI